MKWSVRHRSPRMIRRLQPDCKWMVGKVDDCKRLQLGTLVRFRTWSTAMEYANRQAMTDSLKVAQDYVLGQRR